MIGYITT